MHLQSIFFVLRDENCISFYTEFISMAASGFRNNTNRSSMSKYVHSTLQCNVVLDRLEQSTIDQIMQNSPEDDDKIIATMVRIFYLIK